MIETFENVDDALDFLDALAYDASTNDAYFKAELLKTSDGRWRVGVYNNSQLELDI